MSCPAPCLQVQYCQIQHETEFLMFAVWRAFDLVPMHVPIPIVAKPTLLPSNMFGLCSVGPMFQGVSTRCCRFISHRTDSRSGPGPALGNMALQARVDFALSFCVWANWEKIAFPQSVLPQRRLTYLHRSRCWPVL